MTRRQNPKYAARRIAIKRHERWLATGTEERGWMTAREAFSRAEAMIKDDNAIPTGARIEVEVEAFLPEMGGGRDPGDWKVHCRLLARNGSMSLGGLGSCATRTNICSGVRWEVLILNLRTYLRTRSEEDKELDFRR